MKHEDEFLWWQRRGLIGLCVGILLYGVIAKPILLVMLPVLLFASLFALSGILRDRRQ